MQTKKASETDVKLAIAEQAKIEHQLEVDQKVRAAGQKIVRVVTLGGREFIGRCGLETFRDQIGDENYVLTGRVTAKYWSPPKPDNIATTTIPSEVISDVQPLHSIHLLPNANTAIPA